MPKYLKNIFDINNEGTKRVSASFISILIGFVFGGILLFITALCISNISLSSAFDGFRVMLAGVFNLGLEQQGSIWREQQRLL